ncbi:MAG: hypothetical protein IPQ09_14580 [Myxococcales bacterium]|nr:hypothetical protein [Myxococcales bacterium]HQY59887.1 hypothetical protein [Polyangiaceae bacterium]
MAIMRGRSGTRALRRLARVGGGLLVALALVRCGGRFDVEPDAIAPEAPELQPEDASRPSISDAAAQEVAPPRDGAADVSSDASLDAGPDAGPDAGLDAADAGPLRRVFFTSTTYAGDTLGARGGGPGARGGDFVCAQVAAGARLSGTFRAWLSDSTQSAAQRITAPGPYYDVTRTKLLFTGNPASGQPLESIPDQTGALGTAILVWTGASPAGTSLQHCGGWDTGGRFMGTVGRADLPGFWTSSGTNLCANARHLYCFEQ